MRRSLLFILAILVATSGLMAQDTISDVTVRQIYISKHPQDPEKPQFIVYSQKNDFQLGFGGYVKLVTAFDFKGIVDNYDFITYDIPIGEDDLSEKRLYFDAHQSRMYAEVLGHVKNTPLRIYIEADFYSDHYYPRLRHAYGQIGSFLIGQTWTTLMDLDAMPNTIDFEGPNSAVALRAPMIRYTYGASKPFSMQIALEMPEVSMSYDTPFAETVQYVPDLIINFKLAKQWGHMQFGGVFRTMAYADTNVHWQNLLPGYGGTISGAFNIGERNQIMFQAVFGNGIAKYIQDIAGVGLDAITEQNAYHRNVQNSVLAGGTYLAYRQYWAKKLNSSFMYGLTWVEDNPYTPDHAYRLGQYGCVNLFWEIFPSFSVALEYLWGQRMDYFKHKGKGNRINAMAQFAF